MLHRQLLSVVHGGSVIDKGPERYQLGPSGSVIDQAGVALHNPVCVSDAFR